MRNENYVTGIIQGAETRAAETKGETTPGMSTHLLRLARTTARICTKPGFSQGFVDGYEQQSDLEDQEKGR